MPYADPERQREYHREYERRRRAAHPAKVREAAHRWRVSHPDIALLHNAGDRAKRFAVPCTLTLTDVRELLAPMRCSATGLPLAHTRGTGTAGALSPSLDRIVPALGYIPGNVRLVCFAFNRYRRDDPVSHDYRHALRVLAETTHADDSAIARKPAA